VSAWCNKGVALGNQGHLEEALKCFDSALEIDSRYAQAWYNKGVALYHLKRHVEARQALEKAAELGHADARRALEIMQ
jgi:tetratricopeptide (TPR) repeat protein